jgi:hypothetical protein
VRQVAPYVTQPTSDMNFATGPVTTQTQGDWQWNPLSWSIDDGAMDNLFQDAFMTDTSDYSAWQDPYSNFQYNG